MNSNTIFKKGSKTFYTASRFFPEEVRNRVITLYAFVRVADDFVDAIPQNKKGFFEFKKITKDAFSGKKIHNKVIKNFVMLCNECKIKKEWVDAFLFAMEQDLHKKKYSTYRELETYMYGSAEVIGLMMSRILQLPPQAEHAARLQGRAMQLINFIRDIQEDIDLGRQYIPQNDLHRFGIATLSATVDEKRFEKLVSFEIKRFTLLQEKARSGYAYIPRSKRIPIATAAAMYAWTANEIQKDPMQVFSKKIKPSKKRILFECIKQSFVL